MFHYHSLLIVRTETQQNDVFIHCIHFEGLLKRTKIDKKKKKKERNFTIHTLALPRLFYTILSLL